MIPDASQAFCCSDSMADKVNNLADTGKERFFLFWIEIVVQVLSVIIKVTTNRACVSPEIKWIIATALIRIIKTFLFFESALFIHRNVWLINKNLKYVKQKLHFKMVNQKCNFLLTDKPKSLNK